MRIDDLSVVNLWSENLPYSEVHLRREVRIIGDMVSSEWLYLEVLVNPFTYRTVQRKRGEIKSDFIQKFLEEANHIPEYDDGYEWVLRFHITEQESAERRLEEAQAAVIEMQKLVMAECDLEWPEFEMPAAFLEALQKSKQD